MNFSLLDEIVEFEARKRVVATRLIAHDEPFFENHFPGYPVVPGVLLTEMMGQAAAKSLDIDMAKNGKAMLAKIKSAVFRDWVRPGDDLRLIGEIVTDRPQFAIARCAAEVQNREVAAAELMFTFVSLDQFAPKYKDVVLDQYLAKHPISNQLP